MTNYVYYRVSTDMQTIESQKIGVQFYCQTHSIKIDKEERKILLLEEKRLKQIEAMKRKKAERQARIEQSMKIFELKQKEKAERQAEKELKEKLNKLRKKFAQTEKEQVMINGKEETITKDYIKDMPNEQKASCKCGTKPIVVNIDGCFYAQCPKCNKNRCQFIGLNPEKALDNWNEFHNRKYYNKEGK